MLGDPGDAISGSMSAMYSAQRQPFNLMAWIAAIFCFHEWLQGGWSFGKGAAIQSFYLRLHFTALCQSLIWIFSFQFSVYC